ncbi:accessory gene regulator B family protein [Clostridioides difficile]|uniref:accessory gene regulator B family protein n=1 Tax=Clostridioides difficile TaxID=1496 RepID=UPI002FE68551
MFKRYAEKMTSVLICNNMIDNNESKVYSYGFEILIAFIVNITTMLFIGFLFGKFTYVLFFFNVLLSNKTIFRRVSCRQLF